jgi:hypothetical protein
VRRHGDPHIVPKQLGQRRHIGALVGIDRALEQRELLGRGT